MLNSELIGQTFQFANEQPVTQARIEAYRQATAAPAQDNSPEAPPMMAALFAYGALTAPLFEPNLKADLMRLVHASQEMTWRSPFYAGDILSAQSRIAGIEAQRTGELLQIDIEVDNQSGERVCDIRSGLFIRTPRPKGLHTKTVVAEDRAALQEKLQAFRQSPLLFEESVVVSMQNAILYAEVSGDHNPIHLSEEAAKMAGLPGVILHQMCTMAFAHHAALRYKDARSEALLTLSANFARPVLIGDTLKIEARGTKLFVTNQDDTVVLKAHLLFAPEKK